MKKILTAALAVIVAALALTGCDNSSASENNSSNTTSSTTVSNTEDKDTTSGDTSSEDTPSESGEESVPSLAERLEFPNNKAGNMVKAALSYNPEEWSFAMMLADDETLPLQLPNLTVDMFDEYCFAIDMIGINGHTVFACKPKAGQEDTVKSALEESLEAYKQQVSFYPAGQASADGAQIGTTNDGYCYFVIHSNGAAIADAMTK